MLRNNSEIIELDAVVVGTGILGLMLAKRLVDLGQKIAVIDKSSTIADGASSMNHGWIHQGSAPAVTADSPEHARAIVKKLQYGHDFFRSYAPEAFDEPFAPTYAVTADSWRAAHAWKTWQDAGLDVAELSREEFEATGATLNPDQAAHYFRVPESRMNNRLLFLKLFTDIRSKGALVFMSSEYEYETDHQMVVTTPEGPYRLRARMFFYATGINLDECYQKLTGEKLGVQFCKSHLLYLPRFTDASVIGLDPGTPIVVNHGDVSVVNRSFDEVMVDSNADLAVDPAEVERSLEVIYQYYPEARRFQGQAVNARAFLKPFINTTETAGRHSADQSVFEPLPGHVFALPGKMTAAPYVADTILKQVAPLLNAAVVTARPFDGAPVPVALPGEAAARAARPAVLNSRLLRSFFSR